MQIEIYDKRERVTETVPVEQLSENRFKVTENAVFNCRLTFGTEFETRINSEGLHEITSIVKDSDFITRRFLLNSQFRASDYKVLGDEIVKEGGFWQVDFGGVATINLPPNCSFDLDEIFKMFDYRPTEIKD